MKQAKEKLLEKEVPSERLRGHDYYDQKLKELEESTARIHEEVDRALEEFERNMKEYYLRTRGTGGAGAVQAEAEKEAPSPPEEKVAEVKKVVKEGVEEPEAERVVKKAPLDVVNHIIQMLIEGDVAVLDESEQNLPSQIVDLDLSRFSKSLTDDILAQVVQAFPNVTTLNLGNCKNITDKGLKHLDVLKKLISLNLQGCEKITDEGLKYLGSFESRTFLESLSLQGCKLITDKGLKQLDGELTGLISLNLQECDKITGKGFVYLDSFPKLASLNLSNTLFGQQEEDWENLKNLEYLSSLDLSYTQITNKGLEHLKTFKSRTSLKSLNLTRCRQITDEGLKSVGSLENLASLNLQKCGKIIGSGLQYLKGLKSFTFLNLGDTSFGEKGKGFEELKDLIHLITLNLSRTDITDDGLAFLNLKNLISLNLSYTSITSTGLTHLKNLKNSLTYLDLRECKNITEEDVSNLKRYLTNLTVMQ